SLFPEFPVKSVRVSWPVTDWAGDGALELDDLLFADWLGVVWATWALSSATPEETRASEAGMALNNGASMICAFTSASAFCAAMSYVAEPATLTSGSFCRDTCRVYSPRLNCFRS